MIIKLQDRTELKLDIPNNKFREANIRSKLNTKAKFKNSGVFLVCTNSINELGARQRKKFELIIEADYIINNSIGLCLHRKDISLIFLNNNMEEYNKTVFMESSFNNERINMETFLQLFKASSKSITNLYNISSYKINNPNIMLTIDEDIFELTI